MIYQQFQSSGFNNTALDTQATQEAQDRMQQLYGSTDLAVIVGMWQSDPSTVPVDGSWGFSHAAQSLLLLEAANSAGTSDSVLAELSQQQIAKWYVRESIARCSDGLSNWMNPMAWSEDSRLDYWMPLLFITWYLQNN